MLEVDDRPLTVIREGKVSARPMIVLAHGAGAPLTSPFMAHVASGLIARGLSVVRFHFPYMEASVQAGKKRGPDPQRRLIETWRVVVSWASRTRRRGPIVIGGKSMGGRMASMLLASDPPEAVVGAIYLGYPLHAPGRTDRLRGDHLASVRVPQLFVQGSRDKLCEPKLLRRVLKKVEWAEHLEIEGADHSLALKRSDPLAGSERWLNAMAEFVGRVAT